MSDLHFQIFSVCVYTSCVIISFMHIQTLTPVHTGELIPSQPPNGIFNRFWINLGEFITVSKAQTWIRCLCNSVGAVGVVSVISPVWRGCLFYASGLHFDKPCVLSASHFQATPATINISHLFLSFQLEGPGLIPSRTPASSLPPGGLKVGPSPNKQELQRIRRLAMSPAPV